MISKKRLLAILFAAVIAFVMLFSTLYIAKESGHNCTGEECQICYQISVYESTLKRISVIVFAAVFVAALLCNQWVWPLNCLVVNVPSSLVALKVKLSI